MTGRGRERTRGPSRPRSFLAYANSSGNGAA